MQTFKYISTVLGALIRITVLCMSPDLFLFLMFIFASFYLLWCSEVIDNACHRLSSISFLMKWGIVERHAATKCPSCGGKAEERKPATLKRVAYTHFPSVKRRRSPPVRYTSNQTQRTIHFQSRTWVPAELAFLFLTDAVNQVVVCALDLT